MITPAVVLLLMLLLGSETLFLRWHGLRAFKMHASWTEQVLSAVEGLVLWWLQIWPNNWHNIIQECYSKPFTSVEIDDPGIPTWRTVPIGPDIFISFCSEEYTEKRTIHNHKTHQKIKCRRTVIFLAFLIFLVPFDPHGSNSSLWPLWWSFKGYL